MKRFLELFNKEESENKTEPTTAYKIKKDSSVRKRHDRQTTRDLTKKKQTPSEKTMVIVDKSRISYKETVGPREGRNRATRLGKEETVPELRK
jgi:uncharacterized membrane-anchored protein